MNIETFKYTYSNLRDVDFVPVDALCNHPKHVSQCKVIAKGPAKRNILKHGGKEFICRDCHMKYDNPMNYVGQGRQTDDEIMVYCPHPEHEGDPARPMKKSCYFGVMEEPYIQTCKRCAQLGKEISEEQRERIRQSLLGIKRSDEFKQKLSEYMKHNPEGIARATKNVIEKQCTTGMLGKHHSEETKQKLSEAMSGRTYTEEHRQNISEGRKKMLAETGGFTKEHREKLSKAAARQYANGFDPQLHHRRGWHESPKAGKVFYRSSYEKKAYLILDADETVKTYRAETVQIDYYHPKKDIEATYLVDIEIEYVDGSMKWVEVKPAAWLEDDVVVAKLDAGDLYAHEAGVPFEIWTEVELFGPIYNEKHLRSFVDSLSKDDGDGRKEAAKRRVKKYYRKHVATNKVTVHCEFCNADHEVLELNCELPRP